MAEERTKRERQRQEQLAQLEAEQLQQLQRVKDRLARELEARAATERDRVRRLLAERPTATTGGEGQPTWSKVCEWVGAILPMENVAMHVCGCCHALVGAVGCTWGGCRRGQLMEGLSDGLLFTRGEIVPNGCKGR